MRDASQATTPDPSDFRRLMSRFATGVCVVALEMGDDRIAAMTINSFVSVSLEPLLVSWSLHNSSSQFDLFAGAAAYSISILSSEQGDQAQRYAARGDSLMRAEDFVVSAGGLPVIAGALGHFECRAWSTYEAGDHTMIFGEVTGLAQREEGGARGLGFYDGTFHAVPG
ncbi:flavin reductase family protein [Erythrobacter sp.]|uniref:flavin reductase family protein n=1 Tax=Erythrobacter sp. TaxID=1042 RepID=UPI002EB6092B|nr:flavin reductase family protein [Erythrobacter sp.]